MKKKLFLLCLIFHVKQIVTAQSIFVSYGTIFTKSKAESPIINSNEDFGNSSFPFQIGFEYLIPKSKLSIHADYFRYTGFSNILFNQDYVPNFPYFIVNGYGFKGSTIRRADFELKYLLTKTNKVFFLNPGLGLGIQKSVSKGYELFYTPVLGPDYIETAPMAAEVYNTTQLIPVGSMDIGFRFFKRIELGLYAQAALGHKPYQRQTFKYTYKGTPQPDAVYIADGTSVYVALKLGYRFAKLIK